MATRRVRRLRQKPPNHERWLVSYADFITLLLAFFVVMYAVSSVNEGKYRALSQALGKAFRPHENPTKPMGVVDFFPPAEAQNQENPLLSQRIAPDLRPFRQFIVQPAPWSGQSPWAVEHHCPTPDLEPTEIASEATVTEDDLAEAEPIADNNLPEIIELTVEVNHLPLKLDQIAGSLEDSVADLIENNLVQVRRGQKWVELEIRDYMLFPSGSAIINTQALEPLQRIAEAVLNLSNPIKVEGFTDDLPISNSAYPSNWELSAARAASVVHVLTLYGVSPERLSAVGYGQYRPVADNDTEAGRARNRRVVMVILDDNYGRWQGYSSNALIDTISP